VTSMAPRKQHAIREFAGIRAGRMSDTAAIRQLQCEAAGYGTTRDLAGAAARIFARAQDGCDLAARAVGLCREFASVRGVLTTLSAAESEHDRDGWLTLVEALCSRPPKLARRFGPDEFATSYRPGNDPEDHFLLRLDDIPSAVDCDGRETEEVIIAEDPSIRCLRHFVPRFLCKHLASLGDGKRSMAKVHDDKLGVHINEDHRSAQASLLSPADMDLCVQLLLHQLMHFVGYSFSQLEVAQLVDYDVNKKFGYHLDYFSSEHAASPEGMVQGGHRLASIIMVLNDEYEGGETSFSEIGVKVRCGMGDVLMFQNLLLNRIPDSRTRHSGLPVIAGKKRILVTWIRQHSWD
jgi:hypothetical protein